jgi:hypothetical protein
LPILNAFFVIFILIYLNKKHCCDIFCKNNVQHFKPSFMHIYAVHDYFKHAGGRDIFLLDWRQVLSYDVSFLNIRIVVNSVINLVNKSLPRTALQICMFHFNYNFTIIVPNAFNYLKNVTSWE